MKKLDAFIGHKIWQPKGSSEENSKKAILNQNLLGHMNQSVITGPSLLWQKIETRLTEMGERKRRLFLKKH